MPTRSTSGRDRLAVVVSCEHAGHSIPARYRALFEGHQRVLASHRGWDPGALNLARAIARACHTTVIANTTSRLLVECNRSLGHPRLFSEFSRPLGSAERARLLDRYYHPHRSAVASAVRRAKSARRAVAHVGVHTFTPILDGVRREADVGILYDPRRPLEKALADALVVHLALETPELRVRRNYPYRGRSDGLTTSLRGSFPVAAYAGIELEVNQTVAATASRTASRTRSAIARAVAHALR